MSSCIGILTLISPLKQNIRRGGHRSPKKYIFSPSIVFVGISTREEPFSMDFPTCTGRCLVVPCLSLRRGVPLAVVWWLFYSCDVLILATPQPTLSTAPLKGSLWYGLSIRTSNHWSPTFAFSQRAANDRPYGNILILTLELHQSHTLRKGDHRSPEYIPWWQITMNLIQNYGQANKKEWFFWIFSL